VIGCVEGWGVGRFRECVEQRVEHGAGRGWEVAAEHDLGVESADFCEVFGEQFAIDVVDPGRVDGDPQCLAVAQIRVGDIRRALRDVRQERAEESALKSTREVSS
jgi:hypothetical protein